MQNHQKVGLLAGFALTAALAFMGQAGAAGSFDGAYKGTQRTLRTNNSEACATLDHDNMLLVIQDNHFTRRWYTADMGVDVAADGSFHQSASFDAGKGRRGLATITGKITGGDLEADIGTDVCAAHLSLKKS